MKNADTGRLDEDRVESIVQSILEDYTDERAVNKTDLYNRPDKRAIIDIVEKLLKILYPGYYSDKTYKMYSLKNHMSAAIEDVLFYLNKQIMLVFKYCGASFSCTDGELDEKARNITFDFMRCIRNKRQCGKWICLQIYKEGFGAFRKGALHAFCRE